MRYRKDVRISTNQGKPMTLSEFQKRLIGKWDLIYDSRVASERGVTLHEDDSISLLDYPKCRLDREYLVFEGNEVILGFPDAVDMLGRETCRCPLRFASVNNQVAMEWLSSADQELLDALLGAGSWGLRAEKPSEISEYWNRYAFRLNDHRLRLQFVGMPYLFVEARPDAVVDTPPADNSTLGNLPTQVSVYERI